MKLRLARTLSLLITLGLAAGLVGCNFSVTTAHIDSLRLSKDKAGKEPSATFGPHDQIHARASVANVPSKVTLKWQFITEQVDGEPHDAPVSALDMAFDLPSDGSSSYDLSPPEDGWPVGKYRIEVRMLVEGGEQKDQKIAPFAIK